MSSLANINHVLKPILNWLSSTQLKFIFNSTKIFSYTIKKITIIKKKSDMCVSCFIILYFYALLSSKLIWQSIWETV